MVIGKWEIYWVDLNPIKGSEQGGRRPVLVISNDAVNILNQVTVLPITSIKNKDRIVYPNEALLPKEISGLDKDSIILVHQIRTIDKSRIESLGGQVVDAATQKNIMNAIQVQIG